MTAPLLIPMPGNEGFGRTLSEVLGCETGTLEMRHFPDGESYLRLTDDLKSRTVVFLCSFNRPDEKILPLLFAAATARELGAARIGLLAPYLAYMRQDRRFKRGEAVTSREFARLLSHAFDWLVTVDPHLHRYASLSEIYSVPARVVHAAPLISAWIRQHVEEPLIIGPDSESEQWVAEVAEDVAAPFTVLQKERYGDRDVKIALGDLSAWRQRSPVLVDDIISSGHTMIEAMRLLRERGFSRPICVAVHGLFADHSDQLLANAGARVVTSNSVPHPSNRIDLSARLAAAVKELLLPDPVSRQNGR